MSNPTQRRQVAGVVLPDMMLDTTLAVSGGYAYVADGEGGLFILVLVRNFGEIGND